MHIVYLPVQKTVDFLSNTNQSGSNKSEDFIISNNTLNIGDLIKSENQKNITNPQVLIDKNDHQFAVYESILIRVYPLLFK